MSQKKKFEEKYFRCNIARLNSELNEQTCANEQTRASEQTCNQKNVE